MNRPVKSKSSRSLADRFNRLDFNSQLMLHTHGGYTMTPTECFATRVAGVEITLRKENTLCRLNNVWRIARSVRSSAITVWRKWPVINLRTVAQIAVLSVQRSASSVSRCYHSKVISRRRHANYVLKFAIGVQNSALSTTMITAKSVQKAADAVPRVAVQWLLKNYKFDSPGLQAM